MIRIATYLFLFLSLLLGRSAFAQPTATAAELQASQVESRGDTIELDARLGWAPVGGLAWTVAQAGRAPLSGTANAAPVDLKVLVDTSAQCSALKADAMGTELLAQVKRSFSPDSRLTVITFNSQELEILESFRRVGDWGGSAVRCNPRTIASSPSKAIAAAFRNTSSDMPAVVWALVSGNVSLDRDAAQVLNQAKSELYLGLYNPMLENAIRPILAQTREALGRERVHFATLSANRILIPSQRFQIEVEAPATTSDTKLALTLTASSGGKALAQQSLVAAVSVDGTRQWLLRWARILGIILLVGSLAYLIHRLVLFYRPRKCIKCHRRVRYQDKRCVFCEGEGRAYLAGTFNLEQPRKWDRTDLVAIESGVSELGTHRTSVIPFLRRKGAPRECVAKLESNILSGGRPTVRLVRTGTPGSVRVNGIEVFSHRYLASGDVIDVLGQKIEFYLSQRGAR